MQPIHEPMPGSLPPDGYDLWLDPRCQDTEKLATLLRPCSLKDMNAYSFSMLVNNPKNGVPQCVATTERSDHTQHLNERLISGEVN
jgi:putative SOS response-associated peptidase YedK